MMEGLFVFHKGEKSTMIMKEALVIKRLGVIFEFFFFFFLLML